LRHSVFNYKKVSRLQWDGQPGRVVVEYIHLEIDQV